MACSVGIPHFLAVNMLKRAAHSWSEEAWSQLEVESSLIHMAGDREWPLR